MFATAIDRLGKLYCKFSAKHNAMMCKWFCKGRKARVTGTFSSDHSPSALDSGGWKHLGLSMLSSSDDDSVVAHGAEVDW